MRTEILAAAAMISCTIVVVRYMERDHEGMTRADASEMAPTKENHHAVRQLLTPGLGKSASNLHAIISSISMSASTGARRIF